MRPLLHCCEWEVVVGAAALGSRKVCAAECATAEGAVRAQGVYTRGAEVDPEEGRAPKGEM